MKVNKSLRKILAAFFLAAAISLGAGLYVYSDTARIVVFHTNDIHGWIMPEKNKAESRKQKAEKDSGGFAALSNYLHKFPRGYLLIDSGDFFQGTPEGDFSHGDAALECMNALGYTALALGNHDYDQGQINIERLSHIAKFPFLAANIYDEESGGRISCALPYIVKEIDDVKVGIVGLITSKMNEVSLPKNIHGLRFQREADALKLIVDELKQQGVKVIVVAAHVGFETKDSPSDFEGEKYLAFHVPGIHLILGGHTHFKLTEAYQDEKNKTLIVHNQSTLKTVTQTVLRVRREDGKLVSYAYKNVPLDVEKFGEDAEIKKIVDKYWEKIGKEMDVVIGESKMAMSRKGTESLLGNWMCDVIRDYGRTDFAFQNIGGIRADLPQGPLTSRDLYLVSPFENTIVMMELSGQQIKETLEHSASGSGVLQVSGLKMSYDKSRPSGSRVREISVHGQPIEMKKMYTVATNNFLALGGDGFVTFKNGRNMRDTGVPLRNVITDFVKRHSPIASKLDGRIKRLDRKETD